MRASLVLIAAILLAVACVWLLSRPPSGAPVLKDVDRGRPLEDAAGDERIAERALPAPGRIEPAALPPAKATLRVRVIRADSGKPMPGHRVRAFAGLLYDSKDVEARFRERGFSRRTDEAGVARFESASSSMSFFVRQGGFVGQLFVHGNEQSERKEHILRLHPDRRLFIRVSEHGGAPATGVMLRATLLGEGQVLHPDAEFRIGRTPEPDGVLAWRDLGLFRGSRAQGKKVTGLRIRAVLPGHEGAVLETDGLPPHGSTLELRLPPTGRVTVRVLDSLRRAMVGKWSVQLRRPAAPRRFRWTQYAEAREGVASFARVPLDCVLEAGVHHGAVRTFTEFVGPTAARPAVDVELELSPDIAVLRGRAVTSRGRALGASRLHASGRVREETLRGSASVDESGAFLLAFPAEAVGRSMQELSVQLIPAGMGFESAVEADLSRWVPLVAGMTEIGDVVFAEVPTLVAGRVIPAEDAPCKNYSLLVEHRGPGRTWTRVRTRQRYDGDRFRVLGKPRPGEYRLRVIPAARCHIPPDPVPFEPEQDDLEVRLERGNTLELRLRLPIDTKEFWRAFAPFQLVLRPSGGPALHRIAEDRDGVPRSGVGESLGRTRVLYWNGLVAGVYRFEVGIRGALSPFRVERGIRVPDGAGPFARTEIDLCRDLAEVALGLKTPDGNPPERAPFVQLLHEGRILKASSFGAYRDGVVRCIVLPGALDVWILAPGYVPVLLRGVDGDRDVLLTPSAAELTIRVDGVSRLPAGVGARVLVSSAFPAGWDLPEIEKDPWGKASYFSPLFRLERDWPGRVSGVLNTDGAVRLTVHRAGRQDLAVELFARPTRTGSSAREKSARVAAVTPARIELAPGVARTVLIRVSPKDLGEALRAVK